MKMLDELNKLQIQINELKKQAMADRQDWPADGDTYYTYYSDRKVADTRWEGDSDDEKRNTNNMCFKTKEEAELSSQQALAYRKLWKLTDGGAYLIKKLNGHYQIDKFSAHYGAPKFSSKEKAQAAIVTLGTDLLDTIFDHGEK